MCGITGFQGRFAPEILSAMTDALAHRGPDGEGLVVFESDGESPRTGLGHRRLAIIDLSDRGLQPMATCCSRGGSSGLADLALTYNGEIYNYRALRKELEAKGHQFISETDSEVILHLYEEEGLAMMVRLNGIFAFAIRDGRATGRPEGIERGDLLVVRDPIGVKPLYYTEQDAGFLFGSEIKALLRSGAVSATLDPRALHHYLAYLWTPAPETTFAGIYKLQPGHALIVRGARVRRRFRYYTLPFAAEYHRGTVDEVAADLRDVLAASVERQLMADVPVGAFLSGGMDSSTVVALMCDAGVRPVCYTIGFADNLGPEGSPEDLPFARRVATHLGVELDAVFVQPTVVGMLDRMLLCLEEPQADPAPINAMLIAERARADGRKVLMSGAGGDDLFSGYRRHYALELDRYWRWVPGGVRRVLASSARAASRGATVGVMHTTVMRRLVKLFAHADASPDMRMISYFLWSDELMRRSLYSPALAAAVDGLETAAPMLETLAECRERDPLNRMLHLEMTHFLADHNLNYTDKTAMLSGVEVRVPLLDLEVVELASRIPPSMKQSGRVGKAILKRAMRHDLPHDVIHRSKTGFGAPLRRWLDIELRDLVDDALSPEAIRRRGLFDADAVRRLIQLDRDSRVDASYTIFALLCTELWARLYLDRSHAAPASRMPRIIQCAPVA